MKDQILLIMEALTQIDTMAANLGIELTREQKASLANLLVIGEPITPETTIETAITLGMELADQEKKQVSLAVAFIKKQGLLDDYLAFKAKKEGLPAPVAAQEPKARKQRIKKDEAGEGVNAGQNEQPGAAPEAAAVAPNAQGGAAEEEAPGVSVGEGAATVTKVGTEAPNAPVGDGVKTASEAGTEGGAESLEGLLRAESAGATRVLVGTETILSTALVKEAELAAATPATPATPAEPAEPAEPATEKAAAEAAEPEASAPAAQKAADDKASTSLAAKFINEKDDKATIFFTTVLTGLKSSADNMAALYPGYKVFPVDQPIYKVEEKDGQFSATRVVTGEKAYLVAPEFPQTTYAVFEDRYVKLAA